MKIHTTLMSAIVLLVFLLTPVYIFASQIPKDSPLAVTYEIQTNEILKFVSSGITTFNFKPINITNSNKIDHWKVLVYCDEDVSVTVNNLKGNNCGQKMPISGGSLENFSLSLSNPTDKKIFFSFKLKAYDKDGRWLHSESKVFRWK